MTQTNNDHNAVVQTAFTRQAVAYAAAPGIVDPERIARLVAAVAPSPTARVLEVATGPGHVALAFAAVAGQVVGSDLTAAPLAIAEAARRQRGLDNVRFEQGDAARLAYENGSFDIVLCRFAFHHFSEPAIVLGEMARVCRPGGTVAVEDMIVSEHPERAAYQNRFENLRDESRTRAYPLSSLLRLFAEAGLEVERVQTDALTPDLEGWLARGGTPPDRAATVRELVERDATEDLSGTRPQRRDGELVFTQRTATLVGRKLGRASVG
jgi:SAM-dependent methyltransferase